MRAWCITALVAALAAAVVSGDTLTGTAAVEDTAYTTLTLSDVSNITLTNVTVTTSLTISSIASSAVTAASTAPTPGAAPLCTITLDRSTVKLVEVSSSVGVFPCRFVVKDSSIGDSSVYIAFRYRATNGANSAWNDLDFIGSSVTAKQISVDMAAVVGNITLTGSTINLVASSNSGTAAMDLGVVKAGSFLTLRDSTINITTSYSTSLQGITMSSVTGATVAVVDSRFNISVRGSSNAFTVTSRVETSSFLFRNTTFSTMCATSVSACSVLHYVSAIDFPSSTAYTSALVVDDCDVTIGTPRGTAMDLRSMIGLAVVIRDSKFTVRDFESTATTTDTHDWLYLSSARTSNIAVFRNTVDVPTGACLRLPQIAQSLANRGAAVLFGNNFTCRRADGYTREVQATLRVISQCDSWSGLDPALPVGAATGYGPVLECSTAMRTAGPAQSTVLRSLTAASPDPKAAVDRTIVNAQWLGLSAPPAPSLLFPFDIATPADVTITAARTFTDEAIGTLSINGVASGQVVVTGGSVEVLRVSLSAATTDVVVRGTTIGSVVLAESSSEQFHGRLLLEGCTIGGILTHTAVTIGELAATSSLNVTGSTVQGYVYGFNFQGSFRSTTSVFADNTIVAEDGAGTSPITALTFGASFYGVLTIHNNTINSTHAGAATAKGLYFYSLRGGLRLSDNRITTTATYGDAYGLHLQGVTEGCFYSSSDRITTTAESTHTSHNAWAVSFSSSVSKATIVFEKEPEITVSAKTWGIGVYFYSLTSSYILLADGEIKALTPSVTSSAAALSIRRTSSSVTVVRATILTATTGVCLAFPISSSGAAAGTVELRGAYLFGCDKNAVSQASSGYVKLSQSCLRLPGGATTTAPLGSTSWTTVHECVNGKPRTDPIVIPESVKASSTQCAAFGTVAPYRPPTATQVSGTGSIRNPTDPWVGDLSIDTPTGDVVIEGVEAESITVAAAVSSIVGEELVVAGPTGGTGARSLKAQATRPKSITLRNVKVDGGLITIAALSDIAVVFEDVTITNGRVKFDSLANADVLVNKTTVSSSSDSALRGTATWTNVNFLMLDSTMTASAPAAYAVHLYRLATSNVVFYGSTITVTALSSTLSPVYGIRVSSTTTSSRIVVGRSTSVKLFGQRSAYGVRLGSSTSSCLTVANSSIKTWCDAETSTANCATGIYYHSAIKLDSSPTDLETYVIGSTFHCKGAIVRAVELYAQKTDLLIHDSTVQIQATRDGYCVYLTRASQMVISISNSVMLFANGHNGVYVPSSKSSASIRAVASQWQTSAAAPTGMVYTSGEDSYQCIVGCNTRYGSTTDIDGSFQFATQTSDCSTPREVLTQLLSSDRVVQAADSAVAFRSATAQAIHTGVAPPPCTEAVDALPSWRSMAGQSLTVAFTAPTCTVPISLFGLVGANALRQFSTLSPDSPVVGAWIAAPIVIIVIIVVVVCGCLLWTCHKKQEAENQEERDRFREQEAERRRRREQEEEERQANRPNNRRNRVGQEGNLFEDVNDEELEQFNLGDVLPMQNPQLFQEQHNDDAALNDMVRTEFAPSPSPVPGSAVPPTVPAAVTLMPETDVTHPIVAAQQALSAITRGESQGPAQLPAQYPEYATKSFKTLRWVSPDGRSSEFESYDVFAGILYPYLVTSTVYTAASPSVQRHGLDQASWGRTLLQCPGAAVVGVAVSRVETAQDVTRWTSGARLSPQIVTSGAVVVSTVTPFLPEKRSLAVISTDTGFSTRDRRHIALQALDQYAAVRLAGVHASLWQLGSLLLDPGRAGSDLVRTKDRRCDNLPSDFDAGQEAAAFLQAFLPDDFGNGRAVIPPGLAGARSAIEVLANAADPAHEPSSSAAAAPAPTFAALDTGAFPLKVAVECSVCYADITSSDAHLQGAECCAPARHFVCAECINMRVSAALTDAKTDFTSLPCAMSPACTSVWAFDDFGAMVSPQNLRTWHKLSVQHARQEAQKEAAENMEALQQQLTGGAQVSAAQADLKRYVAEVRRLLRPACPHCGVPFESFSGCLAVRCGARDSNNNYVQGCGKEFCGACMVRAPCKKGCGHSFVSPGELHARWRVWRRERVAQYLRTELLGPMRRGGHEGQAKQRMLELVMRATRGDLVTAAIHPLGDEFPNL